jgi:hypothetical protein
MRLVQDTEWILRRWEKSREYLEGARSSISSVAFMEFAITAISADALFGIVRSHCPEMGEQGTST